jgi:predicted nuclease with TOPRIM domain
MCQALRSNFVSLGTAVHTERLRLLESFNLARVQNKRLQAILEFRENQYQDIKSRFSPVVEEVEDLRRRLSKAEAPVELTQKVQDLEVQVIASDEAINKLRAECASKDEAYTLLGARLEAVQAACSSNAALLEESLKEKEHYVGRCDQFERTCSQLRLEISQQRESY